MQATTSRIAARVRRIKPSPSTSAADRANELRRQGKSIVNLVVGEPDFDTPAHIRQAAAAAIERGATRYTLMAGTVELREAIVAKLERENGLRYAMNEIIATSGAKSAIYNAFAITLEPGDEVIVGVNGVFGTRMKDVMERCGAKVHALEATWGDVMSREQLKAAVDADPQVKLVGIVHAETSAVPTSFTCGCASS
eukprot:gene7055-9509_t